MRRRRQRRVRPWLHSGDLDAAARAGQSPSGMVSASKESEVSRAGGAGSKECAELAPLDGRGSETMCWTGRMR